MLRNILLCIILSHIKLYGYSLPEAGPQSVFTHIYQHGIWQNLQKETVSGLGSTLKLTVNIRQSLPKLLNDLKVKTILDAPCGDFNWMKHIDLSHYKYIGVDIVKEIIERNQKLYGASNRNFIVLNILEEPLPKCDLILCRDFLARLPFKEIFKVLKILKHSGSTYLLATTWKTASNHNNQDIKMGYWRLLDLEKEPFNLPKPKIIITENEQYKYLGLWKLEDINI